MTPGEVAAVTAVMVVLSERQPVGGVPAAEDRLSMWVEASRRSAQRALLQRGPWRLSGRLGRRSRI